MKIFVTVMKKVPVKKRIFSQECGLLDVVKQSPVRRDYNAGGFVEFSKHMYTIFVQS